VILAQIETGADTQRVRIGLPGRAGMKLDPRLHGFNLGDQLLAPDRRHHALAAALMARLPSEGQAARNSASALAVRASEKIAVSLIRHWLEFLAVGCQI
jgi:hypothetical protein